MRTACGGWLCCWIQFRGRGPAWLHTYGQETDISFIRTEKEAYYEFRLINMLLRLQRFIRDGNNLQDWILPCVDLCCFDYSFPSAWFSIQCEHFRESFHFEHRFRESTSILLIFVPWYYVEAYLISSRDCVRFYGPCDRFE